jgi:hypothetical protein
LNGLLHLIFLNMKEAPKNITETVVQERKSSIPETTPDYKGGMTDEEATRVEQEFAARQAKDQQAASATMETMTARMPMLWLRGGRAPPHLP